MRINKIKLFGVFILALIVISGCDGSKKKADSLTDKDIRKGTDGLEMEFLQNAPPANVFENGNFPISLRIKNAGASNIGDNPATKEIVEQNGTIVLGFENASVGIKTPKIEVKIDGKSIFNQNGDEDVKSINAEAMKIGGQSETKPTTILATACYPYKTILDASVCIDTDVLGQRRGKKSCTIKELDFSDGQGAPVTIKKIETRMLPQDDAKIKPHFLIHVKNAGNGQVINISKIDKACSNEPLYYKDFNTLKVNATLSGMELDCDPAKDMQKTAEVRLRDKEDMIRCTYEGADLNGDGAIDNKLIDGKRDIETISADLDAYVAPLKIELDYGYTFTISKDIIIEKVLTY